MPSEGNTASELYGKGVFTTIAIVDGGPFLWEKHWRRLTANAASLGIDVSEDSEEIVRTKLHDAIAKSRISEGRSRITFADGSPSRIWPNEEGARRTSLSIIVAERRPIPADFHLTFSPHRVNTTSPLAGIKSCNYLDHLLAWEDASKRGFHEAVRLNERGEIASACMANIFWERDGRLCTPSLQTGCLAGTTREYTLENIECEEVEAGIEELNTADRIFLTSSGIGIVPVARFNDRELEASDHALSGLFPRSTNSE